MISLFLALKWSESNSPDNFSELAGYLGWYWRLKSDLLMGVYYLKVALANNTALPDSHARTLLGLGLLTWMSGDARNGVSSQFLITSNPDKYKRLLTSSSDSQFCGKVFCATFRNCATSKGNCHSS